MQESFQKMGGGGGGVARIKLAPHSSNTWMYEDLNVLFFLTQYMNIAGYIPSMLSSTIL